jgi:CubicO group peptidase (beta-lactamase class C family)
MTRASFFPEEVMVHSFAAGHHVVGERAEVARPWPIPRNANAAGGLTTSVGDLLRYARFVMGNGTASDGTCLLSRASLDLMQTPAVPADDGWHVGLAWYIWELAGVQLIAHGGETNGQVSLFQFAPEQGFALAILTNANRGDELIEDLSTWAHKRYLGVEKPAHIPQKRTVQELDAYAGRYVSTLTHIELAVRDEHLLLQMRDSENVRAFKENPTPPPPPFPVAFYADDRMVVTEGPMIDRTAEFLRNPAGSIAWLRLGGRLFRRAE